MSVNANHHPYVTHYGEQADSHFSIEFGFCISLGTQLYRSIAVRLYHIGMHTCAFVAGTTSICFHHFARSVFVWPPTPPSLPPPLPSHKRDTSWKQWDVLPAFVLHSPSERSYREDFVHLVNCLRKYILSSAALLCLALIRFGLFLSVVRHSFSKLYKVLGFYPHHPLGKFQYLELPNW